ncbi:RagB/SusD family nutrient uptake outer membrane protein [Chitinophaga agrisoli]|uniref:RagB/SusD family nutrient uptake outer membrane protein n=1 Tax=Chitinophaga agrisoli TaxID=2607653 RepID=A0A5B2W514_9BACT|nr:RagB/SusD family nutrient uptake outer membrane protein [Chitinophaga agrisoli]KAA2245732.1 RagB/SusD family nutrient uptake outer membrane protein [Chitinophaga agrisoli]
MRTIQLKNILTGGLMACVALTACTRENFFDDPLDAVPTDIAFSTPERIEKSAVGMYSALQNINWGCGRNLIYADVQGLDANPNNFFNNVGFFDLMRPNDVTITAAWSAAYNTIYTANLFVKNFQPKQSLVTPAKADQYIGESEFIRAYNYFYLVNFWAQPYTDTIKGPDANPGVPLILEAADDPFGAGNLVQRASVKAVYDQIEKDLKDAAIRLPEDYGDANSRVTRATKGAARALLMRMYLYKGDWANAVTYADSLINSGLYELNPTPATLYRNYTTKESIFSIAFSGSNNPDRNNALSAHYSPTVRGDISLSNAFLQLMDTTIDLRYKDLVITTVRGTGPSASTYYWSTKYTSFGDWVPVIRFAEVLLVKAEALARQGIPTAPLNTDALGCLMRVRARSNGGPMLAATNAQLIQAILKERRIELAFEGQAYFDLQRTRQPVPPHASIQHEQPYGSNYRVWPIPQRDMNIMPDLIQNPGY